MRVYEIGCPGLTSPVLTNFTWSKLPRPVYPLDEGTTWDTATSRHLKEIAMLRRSLLVLMAFCPAARRTGDRRSPTRRCGW